MPSLITSFHEYIHQSSHPVNRLDKRQPYACPGNLYDGFAYNGSNGRECTAAESLAVHLLYATGGE